MALITFPGPASPAKCALCQALPEWVDRYQVRGHGNLVGVFDGFSPPAARTMWDYVDSLYESLGPSFESTDDVCMEEFLHMPNILSKQLSIAVEYPEL